MDEVIRRAQAGDPAALGHLWRAYQHLLLRYFRGKGMAEPEDLASTVWIEVASALPRFQGDETDFRRWLFTIAARRRIDDIRAGKRRAERLEREHRTTRIVDDDHAARSAEERDDLSRAIEMIRTLPSDQAEAVLLRVLGDFSVTEVAEIMGRREGAVRVLVHRGLKKLSARPGVTDPTSRTMYPT